MFRYDGLVVLAGVLGYLVSIGASTVLVLLFFDLNRRLLPGGKVTKLFTGESAGQSTAPAIALGAATLCQAYLLRHAVFVVMALVQDFLVAYGDHLSVTSFPFGPFLKLVVLALGLLFLLCLLALASILIAGKFFDWMTRGIEELHEIANGNVPVAILFAFVLFAVTAILNEGIEDVARALVPYSRSGVVSVP